MTPLTTIIAAVIMSLRPEVPQEKATVFAAAIEKASRKYEIEWSLLTAILRRESHFQEKNISRTSDYGIGQHHCPSFYCGKKPTPEQRACLLDAECNIDLTAQELIYKIKTCKRLGKRCTDFVQMYNPHSKGYAARTRAMQREIEDLARKKRLLMDRVVAERPIL